MCKSSEFAGDWVGSELMKNLAHLVLPQSLQHSLTTGLHAAVLAQSPTLQRTRKPSSAIGAIVLSVHGHHTACRKVQF